MTEQGMTERGMTERGWTATDIPDQSGRRVIVTGGNNGIGYFTVLELARKGAEVVLAARDAGRGGGGAGPGAG